MSEELASWIAGGIARKGWTLRQLARRAEVSHSAVANAANGVTKPKPETLQALARALQTPVEEVYRMAGDLPPQRGVSEARAAYLIDDETRLLELYRELPEDDKGLVMDLVDRLTGRRVARIVGRGAADAGEETKKPD